MRAATGIRRWRRNPLCRATDLTEAWLAVVAALVIVTAAPAVGWITGTLTEEALHQSVRIQRQQRHPTTATVVEPVAGPRPAAFDPESAAADVNGIPVVATWTAPDGSRHTEKLATALRSARPGDRFTVWTDDFGRIVPRPMDPDTARVHAVFAGIGAALASGLLVECARRLVLWRIMTHRFAALDRAWAAVGPDSGRAGAGS